MWQLTSLSCVHYYFSGSFILAPRLLVTDTVLCSNPDDVPCHRFQSTNCKGWFISLTSSGEWTKGAHFPVFHNIVYVISSTIIERRVPLNNSSRIPYTGIHLLSWWRWGWERWKVVPTVIWTPIINTFVLGQSIVLYMYMYVQLCVYSAILNNYNLELLHMFCSKRLSNKKRIETKLTCTWIFRSFFICPVVSTSAIADWSSFWIHSCVCRTGLTHCIPQSRLVVSAGTGWKTDRWLRHGSSKIPPNLTLHCQ